MLWHSILHLTVILMGKMDTRCLALLVSTLSVTLHHRCMCVCASVCVCGFLRTQRPFEPFQIPFYFSKSTRLFFFILC